MFRLSIASLPLMFAAVLLLSGCHERVGTDSIQLPSTIAVTFHEGAPYDQQEALVEQLQGVDGVISVEPYASGGLSAEGAGVEAGGPSLEVRMRPGDAEAEAAVRRIIGQHRQEAGVSYVSGD